MAEKRIAESTTTDEASGPVPRARGATEPGPAKAAKATKRAKAAKSATATKTTAKTTAKATKATKTTKTTKPTAKATKAAKASPAPATPTAPVQPAAVPGAWTAAVREALSQADQPPQRLAELAVAELGPRAAGWAGWLRDTYPDPPAHGIARLAAHEARQASWALALVEAGGPVTAALSVPALAWVRAMLVLKIAAGYGHDPADPQRAGDLIDLLDLRPDAGRLPLAPGLLTAVRGGRRRLAGFAAARIGVRRRTPVHAALRMLIAGADHGDQLERLAHRAARHYRHSKP